MKKYKTEISSTSIESFRDEILNGRYSTKTEKAIKAFSYFKTLTARELAEAIQVEKGTAASICNTLYNQKKILFYCKRKNATHKNAKAYALNPNEKLNKITLLEMAHEKIQRGLRKQKVALEMIEEGEKEIIKLKKEAIRK